MSAGTSTLFDDREQALVDRARKAGGECRMGYGDTSATIRLTERGVGHWEQRHPFVATFVLAEGWR